MPSTRTSSGNKKQFPASDLNKIRGTEADDILGNTIFGDMVLGKDGNDIFTYAGGSDVFIGGDGEDRLRLDLAPMDLQMAQRGTNVTIELDGEVLILRSVEQIEFSDESIFQIGQNNGVFTAPDSASTDEDTAISIDVLANDIDIEGDAFHITGYDALSANGAAISLNPDGTLSYDPSGSAYLNALDTGANVTDTFTYTVTDQVSGIVTTETVEVLVAGLSDQPSPDATITFDNGVVAGSNYSENGFTGYVYSYAFITVADDPIQDLDGDGDLDFGVTDDYLPATGIDRFAYIDFTQDNGDAFDFVSFDLVADGGTDLDGSLVFSGYYEAGGYAVATYIEGGDGLWDVSGSQNGQTFNENNLTQDDMLAYFADLSSLYMRSADSTSGGPMDTGNGIGFDNLVFV